MNVDFHTNLPSGRTLAYGLYGASDGPVVVVLDGPGWRGLGRAAAPAAFARQARLLARTWDIDVRRISAPVALWVGELDPTHPPVMSRRLAQRLGNAPVSVVPGAATFGMLCAYPAALRHAVGLGAL